MTSVGDKTGTCLKTGPVMVNLSAVGSNEKGALWGDLRVQHVYRP